MCDKGNVKSENLEVVAEFFIWFSFCHKHEIICVLLNRLIHCVISFDRHDNGASDFGNKST